MDPISQLFNNRDALNNIATTRDKLRREKQLVDAQLQAGVDQQLKLLSQGTALLQNVRRELTKSKGALGDIESLYTETAPSVANFDMIERLSSVAAVFDTTDEFASSFSTLHSNLAEISEMMQKDGRFHALTQQMEHLLPIHNALVKLRKVQDKASMYATSSSQDVRATIMRHFEPLDEFGEAFDETLFAISKRLLDIVKSKNPSLVVRVAKIIDYEEKQDLMADTLSRSSADHPRIFSDPLLARRTRQYPQRFFKVIQESIKEKFSAYLEKYDPHTSPHDALNKMIWVYKDLNLCRSQLSQCVPERWNLFDKYLAHYHQGVYSVLKTIMKKEPSAEIILMVLDYSKDYYHTIHKLFGVEKEKLTPPLLDGHEKQLYNNFLEILVNKLTEWYGAVSVAEKKPFIYRSTAPDTMEDGTLALSQSVDVSKLISQQLETAAESGQAVVVVGCVNACCDILAQRQREWVDLIQKEVRKEISGSVEDVPEGLFEYLIALANEEDRSHSFVADLTLKWTEPLSGKYRVAAQTRFDETRDGYTTVLMTALRGMIGIIHNDLVQAFGNVFVSKKWTQGALMGDITLTLEEYLNDTVKLMLPDLFDVFLEKLCAEVIISYLKAGAHARGKIKNQDHRDRILADVKDLHSLFAKEEYGADEAALRDLFEIFGHVIAILESSVQELPDRFMELREAYWDAPLDLFEVIMYMRKDLDNKDIKAIINSIRQAAVHQQRVHSGDELGEELKPKTFLQGFRR